MWHSCQQKKGGGEGRKIGVLVILAEGRDRFSEEHAQLFLLLKEPFAIALGNLLHIRKY